MLSIALLLVAGGAMAQLRYENEFVHWTMQHNKVYSHDDFFPRFNTFRANLQEIERINSLNLSFTLAMNQVFFFQSPLSCWSHTRY